MEPLFSADGLSSLLPQEPSTGGWWKVSEVFPEGAGAAQCPGELDTRPREWQGARGADRGPAPPFHCALCQLQVNSETQLKQVGEMRPGTGAGAGLRGWDWCWMPGGSKQRRRRKAGGTVGS